MARDRSDVAHAPGCPRLARLVEQVESVTSAGREAVARCLACRQETRRPLPPATAAGELVVSADDVTRPLGFGYVVDRSVWRGARNVGAEG
jgi:hypothetical protein